MISRVPVKDQPHLYRNSNGAIINTNNDELLAYQKKRDLARRQHSDIENLKASINTLNADMNEIKSALKTIIEIIK